MEAATYLILVIGVMGALDIAFFHSVSHGIRSHPDSVAELITHSLRGPTYAALFVLVPNFQMQGLFAWGFVSLLAFDLGISICDFWLEQESRRFLGGLPSGEYVLHILLAMVFGAFVMGSVGPVIKWMDAPTRLLYSPVNVPWILRLVLLIMAVLVLISGIQDGLAAWRLRKRPRRAANPGEDDPRAFVRPREVVRSLAPRWMKSVLLAAGFYNLVWGAFVVLFPELPFQWIGLPPLNYLEVWQCVGMIVGVYGVGYIIASTSPFVHWPIVLVGLLGKIFGPIGMVWAVSHGRLPPVASLTCLTNDLLWWVPFGLILMGAYLQRQSQPESASPGVHAQ